MFKRNVLAVSLSLGLAAFAGQASADVVGGGASLSAGVFNAIIIGEGYDYETYMSVGSGAGKNAFFNYDASFLGYTSPLPDVHYAGSDSIVDNDEYFDYYNTVLPAIGDIPANEWGDLIQIPFAATSVTVPFNNSDITTGIEITSSELAQVFAGTITDWQTLDASLPSKQIVVVHRSDGSGTVEIFTRHLAAVEPTLFTTNKDFLSALVGSIPGSADFRSASGSSGVVSLMNTIDGAITFVSPDYVDPSDATEVAQIVNQNDSTSYLPTQVNVTVTINSEAPPTGTAAEDARNWAPLFEDPSAGYPIVGFTYKLLSTCYAPSTPDNGAEILSFLNAHYTGVHDSYILAGNLIPLPTAWDNAIRARYALLPATRINGSSCSGLAGR